MSVKLKKGWYVDANGNRWAVALYTREQAELNSVSLTDCENCCNCCNCVDCVECWNCVDCRDCVSCADCENCRECRSCWDCVDCVECWNCVDCRDCVSCESCGDCKDCRGCVGCWSCIDCRSCRNCMDCRSCREYKKNPARLVGPAMGSRGVNPVVYWLEGNVQCVVGCFRGDLDALEQKVRETHANNKEHFNSYMHFIETAKRIIKEFEK